MKRDPYSAPFNFEAIPHWLAPDLNDATKEINYRGLKFIAVNTLSVAVNFLLCAIPVGIYLYFYRVNELHIVISTIKWWLILSIPWGVMVGLAAWWDFTRAHRKLAKEKANK